MTALTCFLLVFPLVEDQTTLGAQEWLMRAMPGYSPALAPTPLSGSPPTTHYTFTICTMVERSLLLSPLNVSCPWNLLWILLLLNILTTLRRGSPSGSESWRSSTLALMFAGMVSTWARILSRLASSVSAMFTTSTGSSVMMVSPGRMVLVATIPSPLSAMAFTV